MKQIIKKSCAAIACLLILFSVAIALFTSNEATSIYAQDVDRRSIVVSEMTAYGTAEQNDRLYTLVESHMLSNMGEDLIVVHAKNLLDFNGNSYTLFELSPEGYIIYHNDSGKFVEYSATSLSPYLGYYEELYYGGPMQFYVKEEETFLHTILGDKITEAELEDMASASQERADAYVANVYDANRSYVENNSASFTVSTTAMQPQNTQISTRSIKRISMADYFPRLKTQSEIGYYDITRDGLKYGLCGYVAANLLLGFHYFANDYGLMNDESYVNVNRQTMNGPGLTRHLVELNGFNPDTDTPGGTIASDICTLIGKYLDEVRYQLAWRISWRLFETDAVNTLNKGYPVALFGNYPKLSEDKNGNHAVVAYKYERYGILNLGLRYTVHYGWTGNSAVSLEAVNTGSCLFMEEI